MKKRGVVVAQERTIRIQAPEAQEVFLAGSFNDWNPGTIRMERDSDGSWIAVVPLTPGRYEYKFIVDGRWCCDPGGTEFEETCPGHVRNPFGTLNRTIDVGGESGTAAAIQAKKR